MKFLIDNALSFYLAQALQNLGFDAIHVRDVGLATSSDQTIFEYAENAKMVIVSTDTDFGTLLALRETSKPSVLIFRKGIDRRPEKQAKLIAENFSNIESALKQGAVIVFDESKIRIRDLPINRIR